MVIIRLINKIIIVIIFFFNYLLSSVTAQETMYIMKNGIVIAKHQINQIDSIIFAKNPNTLYDIEGNEYQFITIGSQVWMAENLKSTKYNDGSAIPLVTDNADWAALNTPAFCWYNNDQATYQNTYGALYNWFAVNSGKLCPVGWHVPSDAEWATLTLFLGGENVAGGKLKSLELWNSPNTGATNETGFSALPGGNRNRMGSFGNMLEYGSWWSSTEFWGSNAADRYIGHDASNLYRSLPTKVPGLSVRCIKD